MRIDRCLHSVFGASKLAADVMVQEYGRYFGVNTGIFRCGCLTGKNHTGTELHGFLAYLMQCVRTDRNYTIFGYDGKQVRDNLHSLDLVRAFEVFANRPRPGAVYNMGGGRPNSCSVIEAIELCQDAANRRLRWIYDDNVRTGDHKWWITDTRKFQGDYPEWSVEIGLNDIVKELSGHGRTSN
jgi:CDP-paratose 2-epimerase